MKIKDLYIIKVLQANENPKVKPLARRFTFLILGFEFRAS
jgi:hypothetical protein